MWVSFVHLVGGRSVEHGLLHRHLSSSLCNLPLQSHLAFAVLSFVLAVSFFHLFLASPSVFVV